MSLSPRRMSACPARRSAAALLLITCFVPQELTIERRSGLQNGIEIPSLRIRDQEYFFCAFPGNPFNHSTLYRS